MKLQIASCSEDWHAMPGDDRRRTCASCAKQVHDLAALTPREVSALIARERTPCVRAMRRRDGTIVTRIAAAALAVAGCAVEPEVESPDATAQVADDAEPGHLLVVDLFGQPPDVETWLGDPPRFQLEGALLGSVRSLEFTRGDQVGPTGSDGDGVNERSE